MSLVDAATRLFQGLGAQAIESASISDGVYIFTAPQRKSSNRLPRIPLLASG
jgi:hypothetical protein